MQQSNRPLLVGITGGIGSGKSVVCKILETLQTPIYDADSRAKWLMANNLELKNQIIEEFGEASYIDDRLNRQYLASMVFNDPEKVKKINSLVHPAVAKDFDRWVRDNGDNKYFVKEAALLIESGSYKHLDALITVYAAEELRIKRVLARDPQRTKEQIQAIIGKQLSEQERQEKADFVINNDGYELLMPQVMKLHARFTAA